MAPTLAPLIPSNLQLHATWAVDPYVDVNQAYLLVINSSDNAMRYIYLTESQALNQEYDITGLTNGDEYFVSFTQVMISPDSNVTYSSGTERGIPCDVPGVLVINSITPSGSFITTATTNVTINTNTGGSFPELIVFHLFDETSGEILNILLPIPNHEYTQSFTLNGLDEDHTYSVTCQAINNAGYSSLSNNYTFIQNTDIPVSPAITSAVSGLYQAVEFTFTATQLTPLLTSVSFEYQPPLLQPANVWYPLGTYNMSSEYVTGTLITVLSSVLNNSVTLVNGNAYNFRARASNLNGFSTYSSTVSAVPVQTPVIGSAGLETNYTDFTCSGFTSRWDIATNGTFPSFVQSRFYSPDLFVEQDSPISDLSNIANISQNAGTLVSVRLQPNYVVPEELRDYWFGCPSDGIIFVSTITTAGPNTVLSQPLAPTNLAYIASVTSTTKGLISFSWTGVDSGAPSGFDISDNITYTLTLCNAIGVREQITTSNTSYIFTELLLSSSYYLTIITNNSLFPSVSTRVPSSDSINIVAPALAAPELIATPGASSINLAWTLSNNIPSGCIYTNSTLFSVNQNDIWTTISTQAFSTQIYTYTYLVNNLPSGSYRYVVVVNGIYVYGQNNVPIQSPPTYVTTTISGPPIIRSFSVENSSDTGFGVVNYSINKNGSDISIYNGVLIFVPTDESSTENPVNILPTSQINAINAAQQPYSGIYNLTYPILSSTSWLIVVTNAAGSAVAQGADL